VPTDAGMEPRTVATSALAVRRCNQTKKQRNKVNRQADRVRVLLISPQENIQRSTLVMIGIWANMDLDPWPHRSVMGTGTVCFYFLAFRDPGPQ
jgi:hypothetical protein